MLEDHLMAGDDDESQDDYDSEDLEREVMKN